MSKAKIKASIDRMTDEERFFAAANFQHRAQERNSAYRAILAERMKRIDSGRRVTLEQAERIHAALEAEGL